MKYEDRTRELALEYLDEGKEKFHENRLDQALFLVQNALYLFKEANDYENYTVALNVMGVIYGASGNDTMAIDNFIEGIQHAIDYQFPNYRCMFYNNIGSSYHELGEYGTAIGYFLKAAEILEDPECKKEERYGAWSIATYLNLQASYIEMQKYELAEKFQKMAEPYLQGEAGKSMRYSYLIEKCILYWDTGRREYVYMHLDELMESGTKDENTSDYVQDMKNLCGLLMKMGEYERWEQIIHTVERYAKEQGTVYFDLIQTELWMQYYRTTGEMNKYIHLCVDHAELYQKQKEVTDRERAAAIDIKIALHEKEAERRRAELRSNMDALTGLGNRYLLEEDACSMLAEALGQKKRMTVGILDVDCFKEHNDTYGHIQGDKCLRDIAGVLQQTVEGHGKAYRFGGDEFVLLLSYENKEEIELFAQRLKEGIHEKKIENIHSKVKGEVTVSQGYACFFPAEGDDGDSLIEHADKALYVVKQGGRNAYHIIIE